MIFISYCLGGIVLTIFSISALFLAQAVAFSLKKEYYERFFSFSNPVMHEVYKAKGSEFMGQKRRLSLLVNYLGFVLTAFVGIMQMMISAYIDTSHLFDTWELLVFLVVIGGLVWMMNCMLNFC